MDHHNKATGFQRRLGGYILENFRLRTFELEEYARESQRMQSDALAMACRGWRRRWGGPGKESVAGALVWQVPSPVSPLSRFLVAVCLVCGTMLMEVERLLALYFMGYCRLLPSPKDGILCYRAGVTGRHV